jgi:hypothetical protein
LILVADWKQLLSQLLLNGARSSADTVLHFFPNVLSWIHIQAVSWPFQHYSIVTVEMIHQSCQYDMELCLACKCHHFLETILSFLAQGSSELVCVILSELSHLQCAFPNNHTPDHDFVRVFDSQFNTVKD